MQKQHKLLSSGLGKWDAGCIKHMMAYDKQLKEFYNDVRRTSNPLGGYEDPPPLGYIKYESSLHFRTSNK